MSDNKPPRRHIMVINDSPEILELFTDLLSDEGYRVTTDTFTIDIGDLVASIKQVRPDLLILDMIIGREDLGWQLTQLLKMDRLTRDIPIVLCTGAVEQVRELTTHLDDLHIGVVLKPFEIERLLDAINRAWAGQPSTAAGAP